MSKLLLSLLLSAVLISPLNHYVSANEQPENLSISLKKLENTSGGTLESSWNEETNTPYLLTGKLSPASKHSPEWIAYEFLSKWKILYGLRNPRRDMKVEKVEHHPSRIHVHFKHLLFQTPVWEDRLIVEMGLDGVIQRVEGTIHPNLEKQAHNRPMHPAVTKNQAIKKAKAMFQGELAGEPVVARYYLSTRPGTPLIYAVTLRYRDPNREMTALIHSVTGYMIDIINHSRQPRLYKIPQIEITRR